MVSHVGKIFVFRQLLFAATGLVEGAMEELTFKKKPKSEKESILL